MQDSALGWRAFEEIEKGKITDASFVANLWSVYIGDLNVDERYRDPKKFFERTYISNGLEFVLSNVSNRFLEGSGEPVVVLHTTFGGGKTHALLAVYHLLMSPDKVVQVSLVREYAEKILKAQEKGLKPAVVAFDGAEVDLVHLRERYGARSLCEFIFNSLANLAGSKRCREVAATYSDPSTSPGAEPLREALIDVEEREFVPILLLDELPEHLRKLRERNRKYVDACAGFMDALTRAISGTRHGMLIVAVREGAWLEREVLEILQGLGRYAKPENIVGKEDAAYILKRALLREVDYDYGRRVVEKYWKAYSEYPTEFPAEASIQDYKRKMEESYPFHPQFIDVLYEQLAPLETFHSTRDVLRLAARVLYSMLKRGARGDVVLVSDIDVLDRDILSELLDRHGYIGLRRAVDADLEELKRIDEENISRGFPRLATPSYSAVLVLSLAGRPTPADQVVLATTRPEVEPRSVRSMLDSMIERGRVGHLHRVTIGDRICYVVKERANWRRLARLEAQRVAEEEAKQLLKTMLEQAVRRWGRRIFRAVYVCPSSPATVNDNGALKAVFLDPATLRGTRGVERIFDFYLRYADSARQQLRNFRNTLVFFVPDERAYMAVLNDAKFLIAYNRLLSAREAYALTNEDVEELRKEKAKLERKLLETELPAVYVKVAFAVGGKEEGFEYEIVSITGKNPIETATENLVSHSKVVRDVSAELVAKLVRELVRVSREVTVRDIMEIFARDPRMPYLLQAREVIASKIRALAREGELVLLREGELVERPERIEEEDVVLTQEEAEGRGLLKPLPTLTPQPTPPPPQPPRPEPLRAINLGAVGYGELVDKLKGVEGAMLKLRLSTDELEEAERAITILKSVIVRLGHLEQRGYEVSLDLTSEVFDDEKTIDLRVSGSTRTTKSCREILEGLSRLGARRLKYDLRVSLAEGREPLESSEVAKILESKIIRSMFEERYRGYKFKATAKLRPRRSQ